MAKGLNINAIITIKADNKMKDRIFVNEIFFIPGLPSKLFPLNISSILLNHI